jgi:hypothetical protein
MSDSSPVPSVSIASLNSKRSGPFTALDSNADNCSDIIDDIIADILEVDEEASIPKSICTIGDTYVSTEVSELTFLTKSTLSRKTRHHTSRRKVFRTKTENEKLSPVNLALLMLVAIFLAVRFDRNMSNRNREIEIEQPSQLRRKLLSVSSSNPYSYKSLISSSIQLPQYSLQSALSQKNIYRASFALLVYDPSNDEFYILYSKQYPWISSVGKLSAAMRLLTHMLRLEFGHELERMRELNQELIIPVSSGDWPNLSGASLECVRNNLESGSSCVDDSNGMAPIFHFGSIFRQSVFPNMIGMPPPEARHLHCFDEWASQKTVCAASRAKSQEDPSGELVYGEEYGIKWESLKDQVVWRGTDFNYLGHLYANMERPKKPRFSRANTSRMTKKESAFEALKEDFAKLVPRWKGVALTTEAEKKVQNYAREKKAARRVNEQILPWVNIKFSHFVGSAGKTKTVGSEEYKK